MVALLAHFIVGVPLSMSIIPIGRAYYLGHGGYANALGPTYQGLG
jgi:hypothetical protein